MNLLKKYKLPIIIISILLVSIVIIFVTQDFVASMMTVLAGAGATAAALKDKWMFWQKTDRKIKDEIEIHNTLIDNLSDDDLSSEIDSAVKRRNRKTRKN